MDEARIDDAHISIGARVRLRAPSPLLELRADTGTVVRSDKWDGYYIVKLDRPALLRHDPRAPEELAEVAEAADNMEVLAE